MFPLRRCPKRALFRSLVLERRGVFNHGLPEVSIESRNDESWLTLPIEEGTNVTGVPMSMPEGHAIIDCGAAIGEQRIPVLKDKVHKCSNVEVMETRWARLSREGLLVTIDLGRLLIWSIAVGCLVIDDG